MTKKIVTMVQTLAVVLGVAGAARAEQTPAQAQADIQKTFGFTPQFMLKLPPTMLPGAWDELKSLQLNPHTALNGRSKELIGLAVSAQVPCRYCIYAHTEFAKLNGANENQIGEAVAMAALTRHWSTFLNGIQTDETKFRAEIAKIIANVKAAVASKAPAPAPMNVVDGSSALAQVTQLLGMAPDFIKQFPDVARAGAWKQMRDVQLNPQSALSGKDKELIGLAVAAQVPCKFCIVAHTEFAKLNGASDVEIKEAIAMASLTRNLSTMLNGLQVDEAQFRRDIDRLVKGAKTSAKATTNTTTTARR